MSEENDTGGIHIAGSVTGIVQSGSHASAVFTAGPSAEPAQAADQLLAAVEALRAELRSLRAAEPEAVPEFAAEVAEAELDGLAEPEREPGRIRRSVFAVAGALGSVAGLAEAVDRLRQAAAPWF
ncbi:DUF5955 family protein [Kitasatospora sp. McL0602]|uniref:DUF5955 family protein n=1 Tax=Kitasatospora sp. McL0602 TaxID=3439530 RepID=UPI003F8AD9FD